GTATPGTDANSDYAKLPASVTIPAFASSVTLDVTPFDDDQIEGRETVHVSIQDSPNYTVGAQRDAEVTIFDNEFSQVFLSVLDNGVAQENPPVSASFRVSRFPTTANALSQPLNVILRFGGTQINGTNYHLIPNIVQIPAGADHIDIPVL